MKLSWSLGEAEIGSPATAVLEACLQAETGGEIAHAAQPAAGLGGEPPRHQQGRLGRAVLRRQHVLVGDAAAGIRALVIADAADALAEGRTFLAAPDFARLARVQRPEPGHAADAGGIKAPLHVRADARQVAQRQRQDTFGQFVAFDHGQPVGLLHVGSQLGEKLVRRDADRTADALAQPLAETGLDAPREIGGIVLQPLGTHQLAGDLVDRPGPEHRDVAVDLFEDFSCIST